MSELKPCPFCGGRAIMVYLQYSGYRYVRCEGECCEQSMTYETTEEAIYKWNRRADRGEIDFDYAAED